MITKSWYRVMTALVISIMLSSLSFAGDIPVLSDLSLAEDANISAAALVKIQEAFDQMRLFAEGLPPNMSEMQTKILAMLNEAENKLASLKIAVYFTSKDYTVVHNAYATRVPGLTLDDVSTQEFQAFLEQKETQLGQAGSSNPLPSDPIPPAIRSQLDTMNKDGDLHATRGKLGDSRISILSAYVPPDMSAVILKTTVVIATEVPVTP